MNNLYRKVAVASVCTALGFALGANKEAKAATLSLPPTINFEVIDDSEWRVVEYETQLYVDNAGYVDYAGDGVGDRVIMADYSFFGKEKEAQGRLFAEFNIDSFSFVRNEDINRVLLQTQLRGWDSYTQGFGLFGYVGNGTDDLSDFGAGELLSSVDLSSSSRGDLLSFDVTPFVKQRVSNGDSFAGFGFRVFNYGIVSLGGDSFPGYPLRMVVETADVAQPVPEPTTIFGSAMGLCLGGWLKRKKSSQQNKTTPQR